MKIVLGGVEYSLIFNMGFLRKVHAEYGFDLIKGVDIAGDDYYKFFEAMLHCGAGVSKEEAEKVINDLHPFEIGKLNEAFQTWMTTPPEVVKEPKKEGGRKKAPTFHA